MEGNVTILTAEAGSSGGGVSTVAREDRPVAAVDLTPQSPGTVWMNIRPVDSTARETVVPRWSSYCERMLWFWP